jgi:aquaporin Z
MNKYVMELVGTFFLVLTVGCTVIGNGAGALAPLAIGASLMVMIFAGGHISGGHYNPAVTLGVWLRGKCDTRHVIPYMLFQLIGAALASGAVKLLKAGAVVAPMKVAVGPVVLAEFLFTVALVFVVLNVATAKGTAGNSFYGLAIGMTVMTGAYAVGNISGGVFNPAVAFGISLMGLSAWSNIWIYFLVELAAGIFAALMFRVLQSEEIRAERDGQ